MCTECVWCVYIDARIQHMLVTQFSLQQQLHSHSHRTKHKVFVLIAIFIALRCAKFKLILQKLLQLLPYSCVHFTPYTIRPKNPSIYGHRSFSVQPVIFGHFPLLTQFAIIQCILELVVLAYTDAKWPIIIDAKFQFNFPEIVCVCVSLSRPHIHSINIRFIVVNPEWSFNRFGWLFSTSIHTNKKKQRIDPSRSYCKH